MAKILKCFPSVRIGQVIQRDIKNGTQLAKVRIEDMKLDKNILMYFPKKRDKWCVDELGTREGDIVVVKNLEERLSKLVFSRVDSIMYKVGATVDPMTGRRCRGTDFVDSGTDIVQDNTAKKSNKKKTVENNTENP